MTPGATWSGASRELCSALPCAVHADHISMIHPKAPIVVDPHEVITAKHAAVDPSNIIIWEIPLASRKGTPTPAFQNPSASLYSCLMTGGRCFKASFRNSPCVLHNVYAASTDIFTIYNRRYADVYVYICIYTHTYVIMDFIYIYIYTCFCTHFCGKQKKETPDTPPGGLGSGLLLGHPSAAAAAQRLSSNPA